MFLGVPKGPQIFLAYLCHILSFRGFKDNYHDKRFAVGEQFEYYYRVPLRAFADNRLIKAVFSKRALDRLKCIDSGSDGEPLVEFRQFQYSLIMRLSFLPFVIGDSLLYLCGSKYYGIFALLSLIGLTIISHAVYDSVLDRADVNKISGFTYCVQHGTPIFTPTKRRMPKIMKLTTLLDAYYWLGESPIWYDESGNLLAYILPDGKKITIRLNTAFTELPDIRHPILMWKRNTAVSVVITEISDIS